VTEPVLLPLGAFLGSLALAWVLTPLMLRVALRLQVLDHPGERKAQSSPIPYLGGVAIVGAFSATVLTAAVALRPAAGLGALAAVLGAALLLAAVGLVDDLRGLGPAVRVLLELGAGYLVWRTGPGLLPVGPEWLDAVLTVVWVVLVTNSINLLDNMDGLSAGVTAIASASFFLVAAVNGQYLVAALAAALTGCAVGFLRHNFHPATIYMGDAGSLFLGFMLAFLGTRIRPDTNDSLWPLLVPVLILGVALLDTSLVTVDRLRHGRSPLQGGRDHVSHRLVWVGLPVPVAVCLLYTAGAALGWLSLVVQRTDATSGAMITGFVVALGAALFVLLSKVPVYENSKQRQSMVRLVRAHESEPQAPDAVSVPPGPSGPPVQDEPGGGRAGPGSRSA
jgi:UDP-GlcNAc:undecaprenyl-phosphate GlcNAc-1-phosphate transferase